MHTYVIVAAVLVLCGLQGANGSAQCPVQYKRHQLQDVAAGRAIPYLFGGIYHNRECSSCKRQRLWPAWCSFKGTSVPMWDRQLCSAPTTQAIIDEAVDAGDAQLLTLTPCDLWHYLRGRTTWIIG